MQLRGPGFRQRDARCLQDLAGLALRKTQIFGTDLGQVAGEAKLHFTTADRQWVVTAYTLAFGSLLLPGGRLADLLGRKVTFLTGLAGFAGVSAIGGASVNFTMLITARACQGAFAALLVPAALSLLTTTFIEPKDRGKAFGIYGAIAAAGGAVGLLLGGALTEYLSWRWTLYVNLLFAGVAFTGGALLQMGPHTGYTTGMLGPLILAGIGLGMVIAPAINTGTFGVASQDAGAAAATVTVGQMLGGSVGTALLNTIFTSAVASYVTAHLDAARLIGRQALTGLALAHGYDTAFWWIAGIFAGGAVIAGALLRSGPLGQQGTPAQAHDGVPTAQAKADPPVRHEPAVPDGIP